MSDFITVASDYVYDAVVLNVVDGDTIDVDVDLGFHVHQNMRLRLSGIDTPELNSPDPEKRAAALKAKEYLTTLVAGKKVVIETFRDKTEKFGRFLAKVTVFTSQGSALNVNDHMIQVGYAKPYDGGKR
jgi:micrococcal nuclease